MTSHTDRPFIHSIWHGLRIGIVVMALLFAGCSSLSLKAVRLVQLEATSGIEPLKWKGLPEAERRVPQLRVVMDTSVNVRELARRYELHVSPEVFFCGDQEQRLVAFPAIFDKDGNISDAPVQATNPNDTQVWIYVAAFSRGFKGAPTSVGKSESYDLTRVERDICVQLRGGSMSMRRLKAPILSIPADRVRNASQSGTD